jgi:hypothetical protein
MDSVTETVTQLEAAEKTVTNIKAKQQSNEAHLAQPATGTITDVSVEDDPKSVSFEISLETSETKQITFTEYDIENSDLDKFLKTINSTSVVNSTITDMNDAMYAKVPVTYTKLKGWVAFYSDEQKSLDPHRGKSKFRELSPKFGSTYPTRILESIYLSILLSIAGLTYLFTSTTIFGAAVIALVSLFGIWYFDAMWAGVSAPKKKVLTDKDSSDT